MGGVTTQLQAGAARVVDRAESLALEEIVGSVQQRELIIV